jgi:hypothetical protein
MKVQMKPGQGVETIKYNFRRHCQTHFCCQFVVHGNRQRPTVLDISAANGFLLNNFEFSHLFSRCVM